ncbi:MAG: type II toxin-antitoxin system VapC family toxin [Mesorhizobium sp.]
MIVDASAILSILFEEPDRRRYSDALMEYQGDAVMSPVNYLELSLRLDRGATPELSAAIDPLLEKLDVHLVSVEPEHSGLAREAYRRYGKSNHPAKLNLGDCFAYALAKARGEPLLFKGDDFSQTDIEAAI